MDYFKKYTSATVAAINNQAKYTLPDENTRTCRTYARSEVTANTEFAVLFCDTIDSTFDDGSVSRCNMVCGNWEIKGARIGVADSVGGDPAEMYTLTFDGNAEKKVAEGEVFWSDPAKFDVKFGQYFCVEIDYCGKEIPILFETVISMYNKSADGWYRDIFLPVPNMIGCARDNVTRIAFWGDSITHGMGTDYESYTHYGAVVAAEIGDSCAYWDLGIGYARASDAASCGAWMNKAKQNDIVTVCFGVNDINQGHSVEQIKASLDTIIDELKKAGCKVIIQTVPPFDHEGEQAEKWYAVNEYITNVLSKRCDGYFDNDAILCDEVTPTKAKYGGHPNAEGHLLWGKALAKVIKELL